MATYKLTPEAENDLADIWAYGARTHGEPQADTYIQHLLSTFELLAEFPRIARKRSELIPPVRVHGYGGHVIIYDIDDKGHIFIIRIRHGTEDWLLPWDIEKE